ncbi:MAG: hypothetical protein MIO88_00270 [Methanoregulaceae archaeon]|nr:hypothetical protein [Methanoregulaceae archaeon]
MSSSLPVVLIILSALILFGILAVIMLWKKRQEGKTVVIDYYAFFVMGISFLPLGIILMVLINPGFIGLAGLGFIYIMIGLSHRDKWRRKGAK